MKDTPVLTEGEVHVWQASLDLPSAELERLQNTLSLDEKKRAERFVFEKDRHHFIAARGLLREILGHYLNIPASALEFDYGKHGKPFLMNQEKGNSLEFNLSHSNGLALYAVTLNRPIGIDVESLSREVDGISLAKRFFNEREFQELSALLEPLQQQSFFNYWVLKEAVVKAMGNGVYLAFDQFIVSCLPNEPLKLLELEGSVEKTADWTVRALEVKKGYQAALAVFGKLTDIRVIV